MSHSSQTKQQITVHILLSLGAIHGFEVWNSGVELFDLQSEQPLGRAVYIQEP